MHLPKDKIIHYLYSYHNQISHEQSKITLEFSLFVIIYVLYCISLFNDAWSLSSQHNFLIRKIL